jgi:hypothetical protein
MIRQRLQSIWHSWNPSAFHLIAFFVLCRLMILLYYEAYITDVAYFLEIAKQGLLTPSKAYQDFSFGYPPVGLFFAYLPAQFSQLEFWAYWRTFRAQMFCVDLLVFTWAFYFLKKHLNLAHQKIFIFVIFYVLFGFLQGHLLYDRMDLLIVLSLFGIFYVATTRPTQKIRIILLSLFGMLVKFVPVLYALLLTLTNRFLTVPLEGTTRQRLFSLFGRGLLYLVGLMAPFLIVLGLYNTLIASGVFKDLDMHFQRGIQVESTWATPVIIKHWMGKSDETLSVSNFGAQHIDEHQVSSVYLSLAKNLGLITLIWFGLTLFLRWLPAYQKSLDAKSLPSRAQLALLLWISLFCLFLATQRVLSPQFFIWLMIPLALIQSLQWDLKLASLSLILYALTYIGFDMGYWKFVSGDGFYTSVVALRNLTLILITIYSCRKLGRFCQKVSGGEAAAMAHQ